MVSAVRRPRRVGLLQHRPQDDDPKKQAENYPVDGPSGGHQGIVVGQVDDVGVRQKRRGVHRASIGKPAVLANRAVYLTHGFTSHLDAAQQAWAQRLKKRLKSRMARACSDRVRGLPVPVSCPCPCLARTRVLPRPCPGAVRAQSGPRFLASSGGFGPWRAPSPGLRDARRRRQTRRITDANGVGMTRTVKHRYGMRRPCCRPETKA